MNAGKYGLRFHHFGLALREEAAARTFLTGLGYSVGDLITDREQQVRVNLCTGPDLPTIELVLPTDVPGPLASILKRQDASIYHICYTTYDAAASLSALAADGLDHVPVGAPKPAILFGGRPVSFHYLANFGLIELIHLRVGDSPALL